jgi:hypothetical protein
MPHEVGEQPGDVGTEFAGGPLERVVHEGERFADPPGRERRGEPGGAPPRRWIGGAGRVDGGRGEPCLRPRDHGGERRNPRDRLDPLATAPRDRRRPREKHRHIAADPGAELRQPLPRPIEPPGPRSRQKRRRRVARAPAESRSGRDPLHEVDLEARGRAPAEAEPGLGGEQIDGPYHEIPAVDRHIPRKHPPTGGREPTAEPHGKPHPRGRRRTHPERVMERHGHHQRLDFVVAVGSAGQHAQSEVQLGRRPDDHPAIVADGGDRGGLSEGKWQDGFASLAERIRPAHAILTPHARGVNPRLFRQIVRPVAALGRWRPPATAS